MNDTMSEKIFSEVNAFLRNKGYIGDIDEKTNLFTEIGMDSITFVSMVIELERKFDVVIPDEYLNMEKFLNAEEISKLLISLKLR